MNRKEPILKCLIEIRNLPLEAFRLPTDGRKWKEAARARRMELEFIASFADANGTVGRFSPSVERQRQHNGYSKHWVLHLQDDLKELGLLDWAREGHYGRRRYTVLIPAKQKTGEVQSSPVRVKTGEVQSSPDIEKQVNYSHKTGEVQSSPDIEKQVKSRVHLSVKRLPTYRLSIYPSKDDGEIERRDRVRDVSKPTPSTVEKATRVDPHEVLEQIDQLYTDRTGCEFKMWDEERYATFYKRQIRKQGAAFVLDVVEAFADGDENHDGMDCPAGVLMSRWHEYAEQLAAAQIA